jgi:hypothetical protein
MFLYLDESRVYHLSKQYSVERLEYERMGLDRKGIWRVIRILISFLRYLLHHLPPLPLHSGFPHRAVLQMTSWLMMDRRMMAQIVYFHTSSADSVNLSISDHSLCIIGSYLVRARSQLASQRGTLHTERVARPNPTYN